MGRKRKKRKKRPRAARPSPARPPRAALVSGPARRWIGIGLDVALAALCIIFLIKSASYAARARFLSDECFHTYIVEQIVKTGHSPPRLTALYSNMPNNTHPLFHWLGAGLYLIDGRASLPYLNVVLCGVMLGLLYWLLRAWASAAAARIAVSIVLLYDVVHVCTQIFYVEILAALSVMLAAFALYVAVGRTDWKLYFLAGVAGGLALLSKQTGYALVPVIVACGLYLLVVQRWKQALGVALTAATFAAAFAVGMFALADDPVNRCRRIYGPIERQVVPEPLRLFQRARPTRKAMPVTPRDTQASGGGAAASDLHTAEGVKRAFGRQANEILKSYARVIRPFGLLLSLLCVVHLFFSRPLGATAPLVLAVVSLIAGAIHVGTVDARHFIVCIPVMAACSGIALDDLLGRVRGYRHVATLGMAAVLIVSAAVAVARVPNYRLRPEKSRWRGAFGDAWPELIEAAEATGELNPWRRPVLSMWTSATWYYSGCPATWGSVNVPRLNRAMLNPNPRIAFKPYLDKRTPKVFVRGIRYILIANTAIVPDSQFIGLGYSETFIRNVVTMLNAGVMRVVYPEPQYLAAYEMQNPGKGIWGNPKFPFIAVEFDAKKYRRYLWSQRRLTESAEDQAP